MAIGNATKELLSSIQKNQDKKSLLLLKESQFASEDEVKAFRRLRRHVNRYNRFPAKKSFVNRLKIPYVVTREPVEFYLDNFINRAKYNTIKNQFGAFSDAMSAMDVETAERIIETMSLNLKSMNPALNGAVKGFDEIAAMVIEDYQIAQFSGGVRGITSGWPEIDRETGGYQNGDVVTWVARLGRGKTWLLLFQAFHAAMAGHRTLFVSPEVPDIQLVRRVIGILTGINPRYIARGQLSTDVYNRMIETIDGIAGQLPINFAAGNYKKTIPFTRQMIEEFDPDIVFVDASYLLTPEKRRGGSGGRREVISDVAEELKDVAAVYNRPLVHSVQFNRTAVRGEKAMETRTRSDPLAHLDVHKIGETDVIAQVSSLVFAVELGDPPNTQRERYIGIKKGREGESGYWKINYNFNPFNFSVISHGSQAANQNEEEINEENLDEEVA